MKFHVFIGIDVSKSHTVRRAIDVFLYRQGIYAKFSNNATGFQKMLAWIKQYCNCSIEEVLFAFEHTGLYSLPLSLFLHERGYKFTLIPGLELKKSMGISRGKIGSPKR